MAKTIVGVDISSNGIRAVEVGGSTKSRPTLIRSHSVPLPANAVSRGEVIEPALVAAALRLLWSAGGFTSKDVILGIGNSRVIARDFTVPKMSAQQIRESLPFQVQDVLPFPPEDAVLDFYAISEELTDGGPVVHGLLVAALREVVLGTVSAAQLAGLNPVSVDLIPFALTRILLSGSRRAGTIAIIDAGGSTTTVTVVTDGVPKFVRIIPTGGNDLTSAIASRLGTTFDYAEHLKRSLGLTTSTSDAESHAAVNTLRELVGELLSNLRNTLSFFGETRPHESVRQIVLTGGAANLTGFMDALADYTRIPIETANPLESVVVSAKAKRNDRHPAGASLSVALGLAVGSAA